MYIDFTDDIETICDVTGLGSALNGQVASVCEVCRVANETAFSYNSEYEKEKTMNMFCSFTLRAGTTNCVAFARLRYLLADL